jgi:hypothetical protein
MKSSLPKDFVENCRHLQADGHFEILMRPEMYPMQHRVRGEYVYVVNQDGPLEVFDVMCSRSDVQVTFWNQGANREVLRLAGPWIARREVAIVELLQIFDDMIREKRSASAAAVLMEALEHRPGAVIIPQVFAPAEAFKVEVTPLTEEANRDLQRDPNTGAARTVTVWMRAVQWIARL